MPSPSFSHSLLCPSSPSCPTLLFKAHWLICFAFLPPSPRAFYPFPLPLPLTFTPSLLLSLTIPYALFILTPPNPQAHNASLAPIPLPWSALSLLSILLPIPYQQRPTPYTPYTPSPLY